MWLMDDDIEAAPECLETMLQYRDVGDLIQPRKQLPWGPLIWQALWDTSAATVVTLERETAFDHERKWFPIQYCNFEGAFIRRCVVDRIGFPDERFFMAGDDTMYGLLASLHANVIYIDYIGIRKEIVVREGPRNRLTFYLHVRNRFLSYDILSENGVPVHRGLFLMNAFRCVITYLNMALRSPKPFQHARAVIDGLRDGLHHRYGRPPWMQANEKSR
jgi:GT2 family glycosyltransferase